MLGDRVVVVDDRVAVVDNVNHGSATGRSPYSIYVSDSCGRRSQPRLSSNHQLRERAERAERIAPCGDIRTASPALNMLIAHGANFAIEDAKTAYVDSFAVLREKSSPLERSAHRPKTLD